ncbi:MAG: UDP-3-O-(3-hydroxymyristoyl)glucosamine N-acyltransferase [Rhodobacterales bacterium]|nr:UDP-3-O-(3-hydroxymyristoyl)glucosamine N-acyltransferase [Rhodobacterales bacterium]
MVDPRFFPAQGPFDLAALAGIAHAETGGADAAGRAFVDVAPLDAAGPDHVSFLDNRKYVGAFTESAAGACLVHPDLADRAPAGMALLITRDPYRAYALVAQAFHPFDAVEPGLSPAAHIDPAADVDATARVDCGAVVGAGASIGPRSHVMANAYVGPGVRLGADCRVGPGATLQCCLIDDRVILHPGVRIGQDGFGFALGGQGHEKVPQLGRVLIGHDVEIGANSTIDRGTGPDTEIGPGTKIDNLVQIGHNVRLGRGCVVVAQVGISGSTVVGDFAMLGGQAGLAGHLSIGAGARVAAQSGLMRDVPPGTTVAGSPALPAKEHWRQQAALSKLVKRR